MAKEVKVQIKDIENGQLIFELSENAEKGDWFDLNKVNTFNVLNVEKALEPFKKEIIDKWKEEELPRLRKQIVDDFKANDPKYKQLEKEAQELASNKLDVQKEVKNATAQLVADKDKLTAEVKAFKAQEETIKTKYDSQLREGLAKKIEELKPSIVKEVLATNHEVLTLKENNKALIQENNDLKQQVEHFLAGHKSTKSIGEQFEKDIFDEWKNFSLSLGNNTTFEKANEVIEGNKPDFIFKVYPDNQKNQADSSLKPLETVVIEAKNEAFDTPVNARHKNSDFFKKLEGDRIKNNAQFAVLVTNLERENDFGIYLANPLQYPNMFVVRPEWLMPLLSLLHYIIIKEAQMNVNFEKNEELKNNKDALRKNFKDFRDKIINLYFQRINDRLVSIKNDAEQIIKKANDIIELQNDIVDSQMEKIKTTIENFKVEKMCTLLDNIEKQEKEIGSSLTKE